MKSGFIAATATAAALTLALTGTASASALGHPKHPKPKPKPKPVATAPQVSGAILQSALLPAADFGDGYESVFTGNSGSKVQRPSGSTPSSLGCGNFEGYVYSSKLENTAGVFQQYINPNLFVDQPAVFYGYQDVLQFASTKAATSYYDEALAEFQKCQNFNEPNPGDTNPGGGTIEISATTVTKTTVGKYQAFQVMQDSAFSEASGDTSFSAYLVADAGTNVYTFWDLDGTNDPPSSTLMAQLISQVQKLYPRG
jgi:hypothetical protein